MRNPFRRKPVRTEFQGDLRVTVIEPDAKRDDERLGITQERGEELMDLCAKAIKKAPSISHAMEIISVECKHPNELAFASAMCGWVVAKKSNPLAAILGMI